jgi:hypothetical protein
MSTPTAENVYRALSDAFDDITGGLDATDEGPYVNLSASWTNAAGRLVTMSMSVTDPDADEDDDGLLDDLERQAVPDVIGADADDLDPDFVR